MTQTANRITDHVEQYWRDLKEVADQDVPHESQLDIGALGDVWDNCMYIQVEPHRPYHYQYGYMGKELVDAAGVDFTQSVGDDIIDLVKASKDEMQKKFQEVVNTRDVVYDEGEFCNTQHLTIKYRQVLVPFTTDGVHVTYILSGMRWTVK